MVHKYVNRLYKLLVGKGCLMVAESFTGGAICAELVKKPGMSNLLYKGLVCYAPLCKINDLGVRLETIEEFGTVSEKTAYEMINGLFKYNPDCDFGIITTGNAGPTADIDGEEGVCFIGVGTRDEKIVYRHEFLGNREQVIRYGTQKALERAIEYFERVIKAEV